MEMTAQDMSTRPHPIDFGSYREFLAAMFEFRQREDASFSYREFSRRAGYASPNFMKLVIDGKRNLSNESIGKFARVLDLTNKERDAFEALVMMNQAETDDERHTYFQRLRRSIKKSDEQATMMEAQYLVYSLWYAIPIREMIALPGFIEDPEWIARRVHPRITPADARRALQVLEHSGMVKRNAHGTLEQSEPKVRTPNQIQSLAVRNFHRSMLEISRDALDSLPTSKRHVSSLTVQMTEAEYEFVTERLAELRDELMAQLEKNREGGNTQIYQVGFQVTPLTLAPEDNN